MVLFMWIARSQQVVILIYEVFNDTVIKIDASTARKRLDRIDERYFV